MENKIKKNKKIILILLFVLFISIYLVFYVRGESNLGKKCSQEGQRICEFIGKENGKDNYRLLECVCQNKKSGEGTTKECTYQKIKDNLSPKECEKERLEATKQGKGVFHGWLFGWLFPISPSSDMLKDLGWWDKLKVTFYVRPGETLASLLSLGAGLVEAGKLVGGAGSAKPETPLPGNKYCGLCNWDNYTSCTEERCEILGSCYYQPLEDGRGGLCLPKECTAGRPDVTKIKAEFLIDRTKLWKSFENSNCPDSNGGCSVDVEKLATRDDYKKVPHNVDTVRITLDTNIAGECYYVVDKQNANLSEMTKIPVEADTTFLKTRQFEIDLTPLELGREHTIYFKCRSTCDIAHEAGFDWNYLKFKFEPKPDELPPVIVRVKPDDKRQYLSNDEKYALIEVWLDENGYCAWSDRGWYLNLTKNVSTSESCNTQNQLMCHPLHTLPWPQYGEDVFFVQDSKCKQNQRCAYVNELGEISYLNKNDCTICYINVSLAEDFAEIVNWSQIASFIEQCQQNPGMEGCSDVNQIVQRYSLDPSQIQTGISKIFALNFRCWDMQNNLMPEEDTYEYRIMTYPPYNMTIVKPEQDMTTYEKEIYMEVNTSRPTICKYSIDKNMEYENMTFIEGTEVMDTNHTGFTPALTNGNHILYVKCRDIGGLQKEDSVSFTILPAPLPKVIRMWADGIDLRIETYIKAECVYSIDENKKCNYNALEASNFSTLDNYIHLAPLVMDWTYYVKCRDVWHDNGYPTECTAIIKPFELPRS